MTIALSCNDHIPTYNCFEFGICHYEVCSPRCYYRCSLPLLKHVPQSCVHYCIIPAYIFTHRRPRKISHWSLVPAYGDKILISSSLVTITSARLWGKRNAIAVKISIRYRTITCSVNSRLLYLGPISARLRLVLKSNIEQVAFAGRSIMAYSAYLWGSRLGSALIPNRPTADALDELTCAYISTSSSLSWGTYYMRVLTDPFEKRK